MLRVHAARPPSWQVLADSEFSTRKGAAGGLSCGAGMIKTKEDTVWDSMERCEESAITVEGPMGTFQEFIAKSEKTEVNRFFTEIVDLLKSRGIEDYHLVLTNRQQQRHHHHKGDGGRKSSSSGWHIVIYHGGEARKEFSGPITADRCMSCDLGTSMMTGLTGTGDGGLPAKDSLIYQDNMMRYWHDAKGRALFVVTPRRHVRALHELSTDEMYQLWGGAIQIMNDMGCSLSDLKDMILNAGVDQNHEHLHLKVRVHNRAFERAREGWSSKRRRLVDKLRDFADTCH